MNYIIINGLKSTSIRGLMIQSLPPITKPLIRNEIEEIDGRDGDIITRLGYSAYDKEITIGLYGNYKIDDVIDYFDQSGTIIFSNEPDKYYKFDMLNQIDFEKLMRFKTATVSMHVQPFKYSAVEESFTYNGKILSMQRMSENVNGLNVDVDNDTITFNGFCTKKASIKIPLLMGQIPEGKYNLVIRVKGSMPRYCYYSYSYKKGDTTMMSTQTIASGMQIDTISIDGDTGRIESLDIEFKGNWKYDNTMSISLEPQDKTFNEAYIRNIGNVASKPKYTIKGTGTIVFNVNDMQAVAINNLDGIIVIDSDDMNAYGDSGLMNRNVTGDYESLHLRRGLNKVSWVGNIETLEIANFSRWV